MEEPIFLTTKLLECLTALSIAEGLNQLVEEEFQRLKKCTMRWIRNLKNWEEAQESGNEIENIFLATKY